MVSYYAYLLLFDLEVRTELKISVVELGKKGEIRYWSKNLAFKSLIFSLFFTAEVTRVSRFTKD